METSERIINNAKFLYASRGCNKEQMADLVREAIYNFESAESLNATLTLFDITLDEYIRSLNAKIR
jgi:hypothetical protein